MAAFEERRIFFFFFLRRMSASSNTRSKQSKRAPGMLMSDTGKPCASAPDHSQGYTLLMQVLGLQYGVALKI